MKKVFVTLGVLLSAAGIGLNLQYAQDDYGITKGSLHMEVLAQAATTGQNGGTGGTSGGTGGTGGTGGGTGGSTDDRNDSGGGTNVEGGEEYKIGPLFTNWKWYTIECRMTDEIQVIPFVYKHTRTYTVKKDTCGKGGGWCLGDTGC